MGRGYTMSDQALAQRRGAPRKHGLYASSVLRQALPPCLQSKCPLGEEAYPCDVRRAADDEGKVLEVCPLLLAEAETGLEDLADAISGGDIDKLAQGLALPLQLAAIIRDRGLAQLLREGLTVDKPIYYQDEQIDTLQVQHPASWIVMELLKHTGATAEQQAVTPKAQGERKRDVAITDHLSWMSKMRKRLDGQGEESAE